MPRLLIAAAALALGAGPQVSAASASPELLEPAFSNTIVSTYPDGRQAKLWLNRDGSFRAQGRRGQPSSGQWALKGEQICLKQKKPFPAPMTYCTGVKTGGVGTSWGGRAVTGEAIKISVIAGR
ncbi:MAG TPA: hypothetical protein VIO94_16945 [Phenylobacterium sp.]